MYRGTRNPDGTRSGDQTALINKLKGTGANSIYLEAIRSHGGDGPFDHNPFIGSDPAQGINTTILDQWETWFSEMDGSGIVIYFFFYDDAINVSNNLGWPLDSAGNLHPQETIFLETLVNRFEHHKNLIWIVMEEVEEMGSDYVPHTRKIALTIRNADDHDHVIAVHQLSGLNFSEFADDPNIDQFAIQYNNASAGQLHDAMVLAWQDAAGRYNLNMSETSGQGTGATGRLQNWAVAMGGAYVMGLEWDIASTPVATLEDCGRLVAFMESTNFNEMAPHDELSHGGTRYTLAKPGESYIAYASGLAGDIGLKGMTAGSYDFTWFDVTDGTRVTQTAVSISTGDHTWARPAAIGDELAVYIRRPGSNDATPNPPADLTVQ
ncbi:MAG: hypothetical protein E2O52_04700 [Gammaproteobacteria bacterium]|nr:MAG: hypothetical protein E2O52_04700 [Gammaproteobacteria bacterium]